MEKALDQPSFIGHVRDEGSFIEGWVYNRADPLSPIDVEIFDSTGVICIASATKSHPSRLPGTKTFKIDRSKVFSHDDATVLGARVAGTRIMLSGKVKPVRARPATNAAVLSFDENQISGFAFDPDNFNFVPRVELRYQTWVVAEASANRFDASQYSAGIADGRHAFRLEIPRWLQESPDGSLRLNSDDGAEIVGSPRMLSDLLGAPMAEDLWNRNLWCDPLVYDGGIIGI